MFTVSVQSIGSIAMYTGIVNILNKLQKLGLLESWYYYWFTYDGTNDL